METPFSNEELHSFDVCEPQAIEEGGLEFANMQSRLAVYEKMTGQVLLMGGQGNSPKPRPKIRGGQDRNRREKIRVIPQPKKPPKQK